MDLKEVRSESGSAVRHPWEVTRFEFFRELLSEQGQLEGTPSLLDVGSGDAWFASKLAGTTDLSPLTCWDLRYTEESAQELGIDHRRITLCNQRPQKRFDRILMLDVLEHVENDREFLRETVSENLEPGGTVLISVPAWQHLQSRHDHWLEHYRRYSPAQLQDILGAAGLHPLEQGGLFHSLLAPRTLGVLREKFVHTTPLTEEPTLGWHRGPLVSTLVTSALRADNRLSRWASKRGIALPGLSIWALCKKNGA